MSLINQADETNKINKYINGFDIIYWINLDRSIDRKNHMENVLNKISIKNSRIPAVDGRNLDDFDIYKHFKYPFFMYGNNNDSTIHPDHFDLHMYNKNNIINILEDYTKKI